MASVKLIFSYVVDWIVIVGLAAVGVAFSQITPNRRPFDLADPSISYPLTKETISTGVLVVVGLLGPAAIIFVLSWMIGFGSDEKPRLASKIRRKLWEWNAGWMGLGLALAVAFAVTNGAKEVAGKPRPDLLARCNPDLSRLLNSSVGGIGQQLDEGVNLVSWTICRNSGSVLNEGFRSFPSGHSSFSFAGLTYLALWACAKFGIAFPFLSYAPPQNTTAQPARSLGAGPPTYLIIFPFSFIGLALYVSLTRYSDFWHHGFDIIAGAILGIASAWLGFRWYQLPIMRGGGWAWGPRCPQRAFGRAVGGLTYGLDAVTKEPISEDVERGTAASGQRSPSSSSPEPGISPNPGYELAQMRSNGRRDRGPTWASESSQRPLR